MIWISFLEGIFMMDSAYSLASSRPIAAATAASMIFCLPSVRALLASYQLPVAVYVARADFSVLDANSSIEAAASRSALVVWTRVPLTNARFRFLALVALTISSAASLASRTAWLASRWIPFSSNSDLTRPSVSAFRVAIRSETSLAFAPNRPIESAATFWAALAASIAALYSGNLSVSSLTG